MTQVQISTLQAISSDLLGSAVISMDRIYGGRNNQVFKLTCKDRSYALKIYTQDDANQRDRLGAEYTSLRFLWDNGEKQIPQPILADKNRGFAIYEYVDGIKISPKNITKIEIDFATSLLKNLNQLSKTRDARRLPSAAEACFSAKEIVENISLRLERLHDIRVAGTQYDALRKFLHKELSPAFVEVASWCESLLKDSEVPFEATLPCIARTLSPSDFGFHNALKRGDEVVFLDFEYFGWDDPAKTISDFLLHPAMSLSETLKQQFVDSVTDMCDKQAHINERLPVVFPLFGFKWCLIILNEFVPETWRRRALAASDELDQSNVQLAQLDKSRELLDKIKSGYKEFSYYG